VCHRDRSLNGVRIDCAALVKHTIASNLAISVSRSNAVKRIDTDWFGEE
jgi:hypothetical protein